MDILVQLACSAELACRLYILSVCDVVFQMVLEFCLARCSLTGNDDAIQDTGSFLYFFSCLTKQKYRYFNYIEILKIHNVQAESTLILYIILLTNC